MYGNMETHLAQAGISKREAARWMGISLEDFEAKCEGRRSFTLDEAIRIRELLGNQFSVETLFQKTA